jgi:hypothetical protein
MASLAIAAVPLPNSTAAKKKRKQRKHANKKKQCKGGTKRCGTSCIPTNRCCADTDCGNGGACLGGACTCASGFKACKGACIPVASCCAAADCPAASGKFCQDGACICTPGLQDSGGVCGIAPQCKSAGQDCISGEECCSTFCNITNVTGGTCTRSEAGAGCLSDADCDGGRNQTGTCRGFVCVA